MSVETRSSDIRTGSEAEGDRLELNASLVPQWVTPPVAAHVAHASETTASVTAQLNALLDALVAAGFVAAA
jgi:hypothetical protein